MEKARNNLSLPLKKALAFIDKEGVLSPMEILHILSSNTSLPLHVSAKYLKKIIQGVQEEVSSLDRSVMEMRVVVAEAEAAFDTSNSAGTDPGSAVGRPAGGGTTVVGGDDAGGDRDWERLGGKKSVSAFEADKTARTSARTSRLDDRERRKSFVEDEDVHEDDDDYYNDDDDDDDDDDYEAEEEADGRRREADGRRRERQERKEIAARDAFDEHEKSLERKKWETIRKALLERSADHEGFFAELEQVCRTGVRER